ncbi:hypothetical protein CONLIGDRAFT_697270 [Coniochaeta ligniaria NRRL 30616]|uniref:ATP synthase protein 8 n=1 Tax=Coniochaeta ligniaria NRRL 30616 TaxID=1408157 RepID=A0A1J7I4Q2_9PEZI|nr:hypothetical protein CONLIGDRAFT_697270 [Coniochaeta ligniaria NRRL 30616]
MPQLVPFYFVNEITFTFIIIVLTIYILSNIESNVKVVNLYKDILSLLKQFEIRDLLSLDTLGNLHIFITNIGFYLIVGAFFIFILNILSINYNKLVIYFPFIYTLFIFILINNLIRLVPYSFALISYFILTFSLSFSIILGATILGFQKHSLEFFSLLVPLGYSLPLLPLLVLIEFISYLARNISLDLKLAANILLGYILLNILAGFIYNIITSSIIFFFLRLIPLAFIITFSNLELGIAFI